MSETLKLDNVSYPGGYDITDIIVAVKLAEMLHVDHRLHGPRPSPDPGGASAHATHAAATSLLHILR
jgi:hypothetical protein